MRKELDFICRIQTVESIPVMNETINDICLGLQKAITEVIIRKKLDATIKKIKLDRITNRK